VQWLIQWSNLKPEDATWELADDFIKKWLGYSFES
jgi:hypothetical protein